MVTKGSSRRWLAASWVVLASLICPSTGSAVERAADRHPRHLLSPARKPAGVPADYVLTHSGFFHPSCVVIVGANEVVGADGVIRGLDGSQHARLTPCAYPRYSGSPSHAPPIEPAPATYDGYIVYYVYDGSLAAGTSLSTQWTVPLEPIDTADQDIAFFNDILTTAGGGDILQPVLDYNGEVRNHWAIESEHCCLSGNDLQTTPIDVNAGDLILGTITGTECDATGVCEGWTVTTADVSSGQSTTLHTTAPMGIPDGVSPGSLETYGVTACDMFPASGEVTFADNTLASADGGAEKVPYDLLLLQDVAAEVPRDCGYGGSTSGSSYTLIFGADDGGTSVDAGVSSDASSDGSREASDGGSGAVDASTGGGEGSSDAPDDGSPRAADAGTKSVPGSDAGTQDEAGSGNASSAGADGAEPSGCGCTVVGAHADAMGSVGLGLLLLAVHGARRRRVGRTRRLSVKGPTDSVVTTQDADGIRRR